MKNTIKNKLTLLQRPIALLSTLGLVVAMASTGIVEAAAVGGQVQYRSITMSDNGISGNSTITSGVGSGTNATYRVTFKAATSYTIKGLVVDFCAGTGGTPFIGDATCAAPTSFTVGSTPTIDTTDYTTGNTGTTTTITGLGTGWTATSINAGQTFKMSNSTGTALNAGTSYTFAISGITNTSTLGTFYARLLTYTSDTVGIGTYAHGTPGTYQDYGGFALSTANIVQVTAKVQESLSFCVSGNDTGTPATPPAPNSAPPLSCSSASAPAIILGHGTNDTLDTTAIDTNTIWTIASTNALNGISIRLHNSNICGGLSTDGGTTCAIPAVSAGSATASQIVLGTAAFGMHCYNGTGGTASTSNITCNAGGYVGTDTIAGTNPVTSAIDYGMDTNTTGDNVTSTYGDTVASSGGPINAVINQYDFAATASNTTPAGIYTANLAMVATGSF